MSSNGYLLRNLLKKVQFDKSWVCLRSNVEKRLNTVCLVNEDETASVIRDRWMFCIRLLGCVSSLESGLCLGGGCLNGTGEGRLSQIPGPEMLSDEHHYVVI